MRSNSASAPWISTWTLRSWPSGKKRRHWSVVNATIVPMLTFVSPPMISDAGEQVDEGRHDAEEGADQREEPAADHLAADLEVAEPLRLGAGSARCSASCCPKVLLSRMPGHAE